MPPVAVFDHVSKAYQTGLFGRGVIHAVRDVSFAIERGEVFALLGPNRAGKTTLVKMLLSLCRPTAGKIARLEQPSDDRATLARIGYMHEKHAFPGYLHAADLLHFYGALALVPAAVLDERVPRLLERVGLTDRSHEPISQFSKGMVQRLGLAQALVNDPELLVLDEPTEGLDLTGRQLLRRVVGELKAKGHTVLLISHVLTEVEQLCDRAAVIVNGTRRFLGPLTDLTAANGSAQSLEAALQQIYENKKP